MKRRQSGLVLVAVLAMVAIAVAASGASMSQRATASSGAAADASAGGSGILRIGTTNYIDSFNPWNYIEAQAFNAFIMALPPARPVRLSEDGRVLDRRRLGRVVGHLGGRQGLDVPPAGRNEVVRRPADHRRRRRVDDQHDGSSTRTAPTAVMAPSLNHVEERDGARPDHRRHPLQGAGRERSLAQLEQFFVVPRHVWEQYAKGRRAEGSEDVPPRAGHAPDRDRRRLHNQAVREEGHHRIHPGPELLGRRRTYGGGADLLHERRLDDRRPEGGPGRLGRPGAVQRRRRPQEGFEASSEPVPGRARPRTSRGTRTRTRTRTESSSTRR